MEENKTTEMTRMPAHNSSLAKGGLTYFIETFVLGSTFVLRMNFCAKNPALRQAANRQAVKKLTFFSYPQYFSPNEE